MPTAIDIPTSDDHPVRGDLYLSASGEPHGVVLLCHGFKGYKSWGFFPPLGEALAGAGVGALSLDLTHNGTYPDSERSGKRYCRPDLFVKNTLAREISDVADAVRFVAQGGLKMHIQTPFLIGLFGHSRGAVVATLNAIDLPEVHALCTWSMPDNADTFSPTQKKRWRRDGTLDFVEAAGGTPLGIGLDFLNDLEENRERYHVRERVKELKIPHLIVHGKADMIVAVQCAIDLHNAEGHLRDKQLVVLQTGHTFGIPYPEPVPPTKPSSALRRAIDETVAWFASHLRGEIKT